MTLLLPFNKPLGTSIWIWQPTWDVNQQFAIRIALNGDHLIIQIMKALNLLDGQSQQVLWRKTCSVSKLNPLGESISKWLHNTQANMALLCQSLLTNTATLWH